MTIGEAIRRIDDGVLMRCVFYVLLAASMTFLVIDVREITTANAEFPGFDPMHDDQPVLPPALTDGRPASPPVEPASPSEVLRKAMTFELKTGGVLMAEGTIDPGAAGRFAQEIEARGEYVKTVQLNSPGGSVDDAIAMSKLIREKKLETIIASRGLCASSCPIVFSGGVERIAEKEAVIGVHQVFNGSRDRPSAAQAMSSAQSTTARVARHLEEMGIGSALWLHALETPPDRLYYLSEKEMADFKLVTQPIRAARTGG
ncbi:ATP-dependent Clp protease proteolytic subunit [Rhizobium sp.]|uniref:ATP-dependent Clp protease proteolytic subunit n=1 Tax=Rhizobium sp. TaxID=391 RepID=UPI0028AA8937